MTKVIITLKDPDKEAFLLELLRQLQFVDTEIVTEAKTTSDDFFASAGLLANRDLNADELRENAWKRANSLML